MTMVKVIKFEIADFQNGTIAEFIVENNAENWEKIAGSRVTRGIAFDQMLDFQFEKEETIPAGFIDPVIWLAMMNTFEFINEWGAETNNEIEAADNGGELPTIEEIAPESTEEITLEMVDAAIKELGFDKPLPVAEKVMPKRNQYSVYECIGSVKKELQVVTSQKAARKAASELRLKKPSRKYAWVKI